VTLARVAVRRCIWRECQPVRSKSWTRRGEDFQVGSQKEEERNAADLILYFKTSSSQDASCCSRISQSGRLVENDARNTVFSYDAVTCGLDRGRVDLTPAEHFPTATRRRDLVRLSAGMGDLSPRRTFAPTSTSKKPSLSSSKPTKNKRPTSPSPSPKQPSLSQGHIANPSNLHEKGCTPSR